MRGSTTTSPSSAADRPVAPLRSRCVGQGIGRVTIIDAAADETGAGLWLNAARMNLLRTPKSLTGPEVGNPAFSFQAWYKARHGAEAYAAIDRIPRTDWAEYLRWYRHFLGIPIRYRTRLCRIEPADRALPPASGSRRPASGGNRPQNRAGYGLQRLWRRLCAAGCCSTRCRPGSTRIPRTRSTFPRCAARWWGCRCGGIGLRCGRRGAGGMRGRGAPFSRRPAIAAVPITRSRGYPGAYDNYHALPDATRWEQALRFRR